MDNLNFINHSYIPVSETISDKKVKENIGSFKIRIKDKKTKNYILNNLKNHQHLKNIYTILLNNLYPDNIELSNIELSNIEIEKTDKWKLWNLLNNPIIMKGVFSNNTGKKTAEDIKFINDNLKDNHFFIELKKMYEKINDKNGSMVFRNVKGSFSTYFKNLNNFIKTKTGQFPQKPSAKKIKTLNNFSLNIENDKWNLTKRNEIRLTLEKKGKIFSLPYKGVIDKIGKENIKSLNISYKNEQIFLNFTYIKSNKYVQDNHYNNQSIIEYNKTIYKEKQASIDLGINNIISLFVDDKETSSLIVNGKQYKHYNTKYNRLKAKIDTEISNNVLNYKTINKNNSESVSISKEIRIPVEYNDRGLELKSFKKYITYKREEYFENEFQQLSKKVVQYLINNKVTELIISKNLIKVKNTGEIKMRKGVKQSYYQIPYGLLLNYIEEKCLENNILIKNIDESYTSKTSCLSGNVNKAKEIKQDFETNKIKLKEQYETNELLLKIKEIRKEYKENLATVLNGKRAKRGLYLDFKFNKIINSDLNGSVNHLKVDNNKDYSWLNDYLFKLCNPIKIYNLKQLDIINNYYYKNNIINV